tara:strand:+ start:369 stop:1250 length:882 start_codon:yes stop_codon:yes gene_type:complete
MKYLLATILCLSTSLSHGSEITFGGHLEDSFEMLGGHPSLDGLFPAKFTREQISSFKHNGHITEGTGRLSVDDKFTATLPYSFQIVTGTDANFASNVSFTHEYTVKNNKICGRYQFNSSYSRINNATFEVQLENNMIHNLLDSVLGEKDFIDGESSKPFKDTSFILIKNTDNEFVQETGVPIRLNGNMQTWLLILAQLNGKDIYSLNEKERQIYGEGLFCTYLEDNDLKLSPEGILTTEEYVKMNDTLRSGILAHFNLTLNDIPDLKNTTVMDLKEGKYFIVNRDKKATLLKL